MTTLRRWFQTLLFVAGGLLFCLSSAQAAPGGGGGATVGVGSAASTGGGHAASAAPSSVGHSSSAAGGYHGGLAGSVGSTGYRTTGLNTGAVRPSSNLTTRPAFSGNNFGPRSGATSVGSYRNVAPVARVNNAWSDPVNPGAISNGTGSRYGSYAASHYRNDPVYNVRPGNHLYSAAYGDGSNRFSDGRLPGGRNGGNGFRPYHRYYYNNFPYGVYYPYLYNSDGFGGYGNDGYGGVAADYSGVNTDASVADLGAPNFSDSPNNYYSEVAPPPQNAPNANSPAPAPSQPLPDAPTVGPQAPASPDKSAAASSGPDSMVEAVQGELARRGYFEGKPDSMYSPATKEAIRRFQTDQGLPTTGRINEATLHALNLD